MPLTELENRLLAQIKAQPFASQKELGELLGISRASVANYVDRLQSKGLILGRAYVFAETAAITCIGGAVLDRILKLEQPGIAQTSQPASSSETRGGVARNVSENLARLGETVKMISIVGNDDAGSKVIEATQAAGVDMTLVDRQASGETGTYTAIMEPNGDLYLGVADMAIMDGLNTGLLDKHLQHIVGSSIVFADTNCTAELLEALIGKCRTNDIKLAIDAVSIPKFEKLPTDLTGVTYLFCNRDEAHALYGDHPTKELAGRLIERGVSNIIITNGNKPVVCRNSSESFSVEIPKTTITDVSGAGDAFVAGTLHGISTQKTLQEAAKLGVIAATLTIQSELRNSPKLNSNALNDGAQKIKILKDQT